jgi:hypothetical protein
VSRKLNRRITPALAVLLAVAVLLLAWPRLQASYRFLPVDIALERYFASGQIPSDRLAVLIRFTDQAIALHDHYRFHESLSLLHLLRAMDMNTPALERRGAYRAAETAARDSLVRAPVQPAAWLRLATVRWILHDEPGQVVEPWKMSIFTGRTDTSLIVARVEIGLAHRRYLDDEALAMLRDQLLLGWRLQPGSMIRTLARMDRGLTQTRALIRSTDPAALAEMEAWLERLR